MGFMNAMRGGVGGMLKPAVAPQARKPMGGLIGQMGQPQATQMPASPEALTPSMGTIAPPSGGLAGGFGMANPSPVGASQAPRTGFMARMRGRFGR